MFPPLQLQKVVKEVCLRRILPGLPLYFHFLMFSYALLSRRIVLAVAPATPE
jgi:hypothetical protein